ncbi:helix-turn-helix domain-containing protein [Ancylobacter polymorphus]|uniref:Helix-turn-helix domain-containing protein n=1 Tax=Ancylobacter polymorphus TaxID=223390 RepID=A0A9E6ZX04_9HYPH|nr:helix-turn-helix domain-containing protein [Ancylobacter polymorphus]UOK70155.1 helix-turn-helix domain-containing protein [Ancylobacter polymorphus]
MQARLFNIDEAAERLGISPRTLREHVRHGEITFIAMGRGTEKIRRMFAESDLDTFVERRRRSEPCPSISQKGRRSSTTTSSGPVVDFTALRAAKRAAKQKPSNA